ncbi:M50 family metallopeptidase [Candidatus Micrarchaeota archaeon]|nr:M50 family metallopeptidase [Candidatus Micrarchaeota archaeon]MBU1930994.1 M50 family metallopeptidase [Candidatus Micrarchaeota archaeon]
MLLILSNPIPCFFPFQNPNHKKPCKTNTSMPVSKKASKRITPRDYWALLFGLLLLVFLGQGMASQVELSHILAGILGILLVSTFLIRKFSPDSKTWYIFSMWETNRFNRYFDCFKDSKWLEWMAEIGAVLGFGAIAVDYFWGRKLNSQWKRWLLFIITIVVLGGLFGFFLGNNLTNNPLVTGPLIAYQFFFGLFGFSGFILLALFFQGIDGIEKILAGKQACPGIAPIIPGVQTPNVPIFVPIEAWISLIAILFIHEGAHGFLARRHKLKIKGSGLLVAGFLPIGAFVKPDEKKMEKMEKKKQIHILSAGPTANLFSFFVIGILSLLVMQFVVSPLVSPAFTEIQENSSIGVKISDVDQNFTVCGEFFESPAYGQIDANTNLLAVNDQNVSNLAATLQLLTVENQGKPKTLLLEKDGIVFEKTLSPNALGRIGIHVEAIPNPDYTPPQDLVLFAQLFQIISSIVFWFVVLSLLVAIANFLPVNPLDGGKIAQYMITPYLGFLHMSEKETEKLVGRIFIWILLPLIIANVLPIGL